MKPSELYVRKPQEVTRDLYILNPHIFELEGISFDIEDERNERIEIRIYRHKQYDDRRYWSLGGVFFNGKPVMVIQSAGREGRDYRARYITDLSQYRVMLQYIFMLAEVEYMPGEVVSPNDSIEGLVEFYGDSLD